VEDKPEKVGDRMLKVRDSPANYGDSSQIIG